jgi:hypothetical protein
MRSSRSYGTFLCQAERSETVRRSYEETEIAAAAEEIEEAREILACLPAEQARRLLLKTRPLWGAFSWASCRCKLASVAFVFVQGRKSRGLSLNVTRRWPASAIKSTELGLEAQGAAVVIISSYDNKSRRRAVRPKKVRHNKTSAPGSLHFAAFRSHRRHTAMGRLRILPAILHVPNRKEGLLQSRALRQIEAAQERS